MRQHPDLARFHPSSSTLRILTYKAAGDLPRFKAAYLRLGRGDARFVSTRGNPVKVALPNGNGRLAPSGVDEGWVAHAAHPDTGVPFENFTYPAFADAVSLCENVDMRMPQLAFIGWDIVVNEKLQPWVLEWNAIWPAFHFIEALAGPLFPDLDIEPFRANRFSY